MACAPYTDPNNTISPVLQLCSLENIFENIIRYVAFFVSLIFLVMLLFGGFKYITSGGNPKAVESAKGTLTTAFLGLVLIVASYIILSLIASFTGLPGLTTFKITTF